MRQRVQTFIPFLVGVLLAVWLPVRAAETASAGYGYLVQAGPPCAVWWAEGAYKVMKDDPAPSTKAGVVRIAAARNEYEPFLVVLRPGIRLDGVRVTAGPFLNEKGASIGASGISIRHVEYVKVTTPTDDLGKAG